MQKTRSDPKALETDLNRLYQLPPEQFVAERNSLAKRAGADGADIRALPKPTAPVWAVNQLYWQQPEIYRALLDSAENLRATHKAVLGGRKGDLRAASRAHEEALERALKAALAIAGEGKRTPTDTARQAIGAILRALPAGDPPGRLRQAVTPGGFEILAGLPAGGRVVPGPARTSSQPAAQKSGKRGEPAKNVDKAAVARAQREVEVTSRSLAAAEQTARREEFEAARAARESEKVQRRIKRAREAIQAAQAELEEAEREDADAQKKLDAARSRAASADEAVAEARTRVEEARRDEKSALGSD